MGVWQETILFPNLFFEFFPNREPKSFLISEQAELKIKLKFWRKLS